MTETVQAVLACALCLGALAAGVAALLTRGLFSATIYAGTAAIFAVAAIAVFAAAEAALMVALVGVVWAPLLLIATMLLSARTSTPTKPVSVVLALVLAAPLAFVLTAPVMAPAAPSRPPPNDLQLGFWLAPLIAVAACACAALLGYGERGALQRGTR